MKKPLILLVVSFLLLITPIFAQGVVYQAFATDNSSDGSHWKAVTAQLNTIKVDGYSTIWLPFPVRCVMGSKNGETPLDFYDLGDTSVLGGSATTLGSKDDLITLVTKARVLGLKIYFSVNLNHMGKGLIEANPNAYKDFGYEDFHHNGEIGNRWGRWWLENGSVNGHDDLAHEQEKVKNYFATWIKWFVNEVKASGLVFEFARFISKSFLQDMTKLSGIPCVADVNSNDYWNLAKYSRLGFDLVDHLLQGEIVKAFSSSSYFGFP